MARSRRARCALNSPQALADALPERFLAPDLASDPVTALAGYVRELTGWLGDNGVALADAQRTAVAVMDLVGTAPAEWYRRAAART